MNILLFGFMGSGKSTLGKALAKELKYNFLETDPLILADTGFDDIRDIPLTIWKEHELEVMKGLSKQNDQVIACTGAIVENELNVQYFKDNSAETKMIYLMASAGTLAKRIVTIHPGLISSDLEKITKNIESVYNKRDFLYKLHADLIIDTNEKQPIDLIAEIKKLIKKS